ncbi:cupin [Pseudomonas sp. HMWF032]|uniref:cupin domain-containing protein n=1 Tax=unclassified Pseudomonas TaxID=196821 RepID=UPI000D33F113|nr:MULTISPECIES: cupin domain-containing protein [unclassified Pseudomonas]PTS86747.1 cupin [Pseudomonas sp. HMWF032]PTT79442.1 cupin [Pseudomonas sp. HMWF010]WAC43460.1 cupin domain-containing protein [Pseudomonas sp. SL4(2022)]
MHPRAQELITALQLQAHPEGGYYRRLYESSAQLDGGRLCATAIIFLLPAGAVSRWHRVDADELWHFYEGAPLELLLAAQPDAVRCARLGPVAIGQLPQRLVPAHAWQAARSTGAFTLVGCTVTPGFDFTGFQLLSDDPQARRDWPLLAQLHPELV